jgi:dihydroorotate dehydrogenase
LVYRLFFRLVLQRIPAERAHHLAMGTARFLGRVPGLLGLLRRLLAPSDPALRVTALGRTFPSPLGVAGGTDKDLTWFDELGALGFGFVEAGTVTALAQPGNPGARVWRLPDDRALLNRMGFPNGGAEAAAPRLRARSGRTIVGVNIGKSKVVPVEEAASDYRASARLLASDADFMVVNVSSPNTPGLRDMQAVGPLRGLLVAVREEIGSGLPLLVKIGPDLADEDVDAVADLAVELGLQGIVATNTTVGRVGLRSAPSLYRREGGVSGAPLKARSLAVLSRLHARVGGQLVLVSVGGVESEDDVWQRLAAGASLVQAYTGFVYGGPLWPSRVNRRLARRLRAAGFSSVEELIGSSASR